MMATTYTACCGKLLEKKQAPKCCLCGAVLWKPLWSGATVWIGGSDCYRQQVEYHGSIDGKRLGYVPSNREHDGKPCCWNGKACEKRRQG